jgi:small GTP-binding protein
MNQYTVIGILAHVDAGKTTLSEALLFQAGVIRKQGRVDHKDAFLDTNPLERERGITIFSKQAILPLPEKTITLLDTPGHVDFSAETERTLQVLDAAILVISGLDGVQSHTETLWQLLPNGDFRVQQGIFCPDDFDVHITSTDKIPYFAAGTVPHAGSPFLCNGFHSFCGICPFSRVI